VNGFASALNTDLDALQQMYNINAVGPLRVTQAFAELLVKTANSTTLGVGRTVVVNIGSTARWGTPWQVGYAGSKVRALFCVAYCPKHLRNEHN
jgi:short-subunit dehydrogenase